jgi:uncharacterized protein
MPAERRTKLENLKNIVCEMESVLVAFSGGADSSLLLKVARDTLGKEARAVLVNAEIHTRREAAEAADIADALRTELKTIDVTALDIPEVRRNARDRCYHCKRDVFTRLKAIAARRGLRWVADGSNADDREMYRPGRKALHELGVRSPLAEAGMTKADVRALSKELGLPTWDKPSNACLASRVPYDEELTEEMLRRVEEAEDFIRELGFSQVRVRSTGATARIEVAKREVERLASEHVAERVVERLKQLGYIYVSVDLEGYRSGSMDEVGE